VVIACDLVFESCRWARLVMACLDLWDWVSGGEGIVLCCESVNSSGSGDQAEGLGCLLGP
jgi:hypothetical protein